MSYDHLTSEERINRATEYAVILKDDPAKTPEVIITELASTFCLTYEQAASAYRISKQTFAADYKAAGKNKIWHYILLIVVCCVACTFYYFISAEVGLQFMYVFVILFGLGLLGVINIILTTLSQNFQLKYPWIKNLKKHFAVQALPVVLAFWFYSMYQHYFAEIANDKNIQAREFIISSPVKYLVSKGKSPYWYYSFFFKGYDKEFRFTSAEYKYAVGLPALTTYTPGDTIVAEISKDDLSDLSEKTFSSKFNRIIGVRINGVSIIDYARKTNAILQYREKLLSITSLVLFANCLILFLAFKQQRKMQRNNNL